MDRALLEYAVELVEEAGGLAARRFTEGARRDGAGAAPVEVEVEQLLRRRIAARYPDDVVLGEDAAPAGAGGGRRWVLDPINGTSLFAARVPTFNVLLAVEDADGPLVAVVGYPMSDEVLHAARGAGCWHQVAGEPARQVRVGDRTRRRGALVEMLNPLAWSEELLLALHREVYLQPWTKGDVDLVTGRADALVIAGYPIGYQDLAVLPLLVGEAGGRVTDLNGRDVLGGDGSVLATNGHLHDELLELVAGLPHGRDFHALREPR
ncbi:inositol monophosphatase family protein [Blastococcus sp. TF02A-30]|uniref:inositol monophosphatase family protein n=1 Tax=Blastococcus sp. TF02A-30 TaxID=2250580 RepID=UPI0013140113|nr:inositol monophosphatase family protein [Blastococcus sp. TF02A-30]